MAKPIAKKKSMVRKNNTILIVGLGLAALLVVGVLVAVNSNISGSSVTPSVSSGHVWGQAGARVTIEEFADFQCPVCARAEATLRALAPKYIDTGQVQIVYRHFAFIGVESERAAQAAECAGDQNKFWEYADYLFTHQAGENVGAFAVGNLKLFATRVGLDASAFNACFDSGKYLSRVRDDTSEGRRRGVRATPTFFVNGRFIEGLLSPDQFAAVLDQAGAR